MDVHPADREAPPDALQIALEALVADTLGGLLRLPSRKRMRRRGDRGHAVARRHRGDPAPQPPQLGPRLFETCTDPGPDLDLRAQKFRADLGAQQRLEFGQHAIGRVADDIARRPIDEEILLLDAEGKFRFCWSPDPEDRAGHRTRVAARPAAALDLVEEIGAGPVEEFRLLEVDRVPGVREARRARRSGSCASSTDPVRGTGRPRRRS